MDHGPEGRGHTETLKPDMLKLGKPKAEITKQPAAKR